MALPQQVRDAEAAADAMLAEANAPQDASTTEQAATEVQAETPQNVEAPAPEPTAQPAPDPFETKYKVLQGKYNAEVPELHRKVHTLEGNLKKAIEQLQGLTETKRKEQEQPRHEVNPKDVENFGSDLVDMVNRVSGAQFAKLSRLVDERLAGMSQQISGLYDQLSGTTKHVAATAEQVFFTQLGKLVPDWEKVNTDQRFLAWLAETDPVYGLPRQAALEQAQKQLNPERAAAVFNAFIGPRQQAPKSDPLDRQITPKGSASAAPTPAQPRIVNQSEMVKFYDDVRRGVYRGREKEAAQKEAEFNLALQEGRVR